MSRVCKDYSLLVLIGRLSLPWSISYLFHLESHLSSFSERPSNILKVTMHISIILLSYLTIVNSALIPSSAENDGAVSVIESTPTGTNATINQDSNVSESVRNIDNTLNSQHPNISDSANSPNTFWQTFYMCCLFNSANAPDPYYGPPATCIYGPTNGLCPQVNSSYTQPWLCKWEPGLFIGRFVRLFYLCVFRNILLTSLIGLFWLSII